MPYVMRNRYGRNGRGRRRRPYSRPVSTVATLGNYWNRIQNAGLLALAAYRGVRYLKGLVNSEMYKVDNAISTPPDSTGFVQNLTAISQGDADNARSGNSIYVRSIYGRFNLVLDGSATDTRVRCLVVVNKQQVADTGFAVTNVLEAPTMDAPLNSESVGRFTVLYDRVHIINTQNPSAFFQFYKKLRLHVRFNGSSGTDIQKNGIYFMAFSNEATNAPAFSGTVRVSYHDN